MKNKIIFVSFFILIVIYIFYPKQEYECFWPIKNDSSWFYENQDKYSNKISHNILTRLDCKINLFEIIKDASYCPETMLDTNIKKGNSPKSIWFIKQRSAGGASQVYPTFYEDIEDKIKQIKKQDFNIPDCHLPAYSSNSQYIIQKEIDPLLIDQKKCDSRIFYIIIVIKGKIYFYLSNDGILRIISNNYVKNSIDKKIQTSNFVPNNMLITESKYKQRMIKNLVSLFTDLSLRISRLFKNFNAEHLVEYQVCGADVIFDKELNPYLLELNSGWPAYIKKTERNSIKNLKINTKKEISEIVYNSINGIPIKNKYLTLLHVSN